MSQWMSRKLKYQIVVFVITYLQVGVNSGYKAVVASCKSQQELERPLQLDNNFFGWADFAFMLGLTIGAFSLGHLGDVIDLRLYLLLYSLAQAAAFMCLAYTADLSILTFVFKKNIRMFHLYLQFLFFLNGMFFAMCLPACTSIISSWVDIQYRGQVVAMWCSSINTGSILFFQICFQLMTQNKMNWRLSYYLLGTVLVVLGVFTFLFLTPYPAELDIHIQDAESHKEYQSANTILLESDKQQLQNNNHSLFVQLKAFFSIQIVQITIVTYSIMFMCVTVLDFWLNKYLKNQGFFHSAHKISQFYEFSSLIGGIFIGAVTDRGWKDFKFGVLGVFQLVSGVSFIYLQFYNTRYDYYLLMFVIGFMLGGCFNYLTGVGGKLLIEQAEVRRTGMQLTTIFAILEAGGSFLSIIIFIFIPIIIDYLLLTLAITLIVSAVVCIPQIIQEMHHYAIKNEAIMQFDNLDGVAGENSQLLDNQSNNSQSVNKNESGNIINDSKNK